jgi:hypothetical protein
MIAFICGKHDLLFSSLIFQPALIVRKWQAVKIDGRRGTAKALLFLFAGSWPISQISCKQ